MHFLGFAQHLFRYRKANAFYFVAAVSAVTVVLSFVILIATLVSRSTPVFTSPSYEIISVKELTQQSTDRRTVQSLSNLNALTIKHPKQDIALSYTAGKLNLIRGDAIVVSTRFMPITNILQSQIPYVFYVVTERQESQKSLIRLHWQPNKPLQPLELAQLSKHSELVEVIESDIHNVLHLLLHNNGNTELIMLNQVTAEVLSNITLEGSLWLKSAERDSISLHSGATHIRLAVRDLQASVTLKELFFPHPYPGYDGPTSTWQTNPAQDYQLRKYNIVPLLIGSLKAAVVSLIVALPIALGAAIYVGFLAKRSARTWLKPVIEVLESIPAVIIGLVAATLLFNVASGILWSVVSVIALLPVYMVVSAMFYQLCKRSKFEPQFIRFELVIVLLSLLCFLWLCSFLGPWLASFGWAQSITPSNQIMIVVAIGLGIGIAPTIFSLAEDAINGVPKAMIKASYALGATRVQTLSQVVLFTAFPGLMAAIMLGFGRAFGETMIVLMVSGNTPVADWDLFTGLRALTANLVIEMPEANSQNSHLVVLFFTASMLFLFTFILNCLAEWLRQRNQKARGGQR